MRLHELLARRREEILNRWAEAVGGSASGEQVSRLELKDRMPAYLDELIATLRSGGAPEPEGCSPSAREHGLQRLRLGFDIGEVVREYGALHVCILDKAISEGLPIEHAEARVVTKCLSRATSDAVTQYVAQRDAEVQRSAAERLGFIAHELRNPLASAQMSFDVIRRRPEARELRPMVVLGRALARLTAMVDDTLAHAWLKIGAPLHAQPVDLRFLVEEIQSDVAVQAEEKGIRLSAMVEPMVLQADPRLLSSAISNLVRNAVKFTPEGGTVSTRACKRDERVLIEVEDECGGLPPGKTEELFGAGVQAGEDRSGFGLGLAITRQAAESHNGMVKVRNLPGKGCVFTLDLPALQPT
jgi:signal transduction histidine kinase